MGISNAAYEQILREYDAKQLAAVREHRFRVQRLEEEIPELSRINSHIAHLSADMAVMRIRGDRETLEKSSEERKRLIEYRNALIRSAGYSLEDLEPQYECGICRDTGYVGNEMCQCMRDRVIEILYDQSNIREVLERENFGTYSLRYYSSRTAGQGEESALDAAKKALAAAMEFVRHFDDREENLFISGPTGTGKTFLCNCIAKAVLDAGCSVIYLSAVRLFSTLADEMFSGQKSAQANADDLLSCDLLIIDDLGTEYANAFTQSAFFNCINERLLRSRHTIISTNLSVEQIRTEYSERVFSRIAEKYTFIRLFGDDIRIIKKLEE